MGDKVLIVIGCTLYNLFSTRWTARDIKRWWKCDYAR